ncbi:hypothetical protein CYY_003917 [Polysphondylium violaceum]|uniref:Glucose-methanol-choline oxidoreductase N-terminal domain-containing protein n=1 Tax=Polysphondylium violaceum TaxID=133409 RepID=A0A8J4Q686_9MYCE|nr:hypothetical protein CYY_003917 [Polysphondylium violaceum]
MKLENSFLILILLFTIVSQCRGGFDSLENEFFKENGGEPNEIIVSDYCILGAGTTGSVLASKLADTGKGILLVEEGPWALDPGIWNAPNWSEWLRKTPDPVIIKIFNGKPQQSLNNRTLSSTRGKVIGGCNSVNAMVVMGGSSSDYQEISRLSENSYLTWENAKEALEDVQNHYSLYRLPNNRILFPEMRQALESLGYLYNNETLKNGRIRGSYNDRVYMMKFHPDTNNATRQTSFSQYVERDIVHKRNLRVLSGERAVKIHFTKRDGKLIVKGVLLENVGITKSTYVRIKKELIVSMGAIETPKWLQLNGIGDRNYIESIGIKSVLHSPEVGKGFREDMYCGYFGRPLSDKYKNTTIPHRSSVHDGFHVYGPPDNNSTKSTSSEYILNYDVAQQGFLCHFESTRMGSEGYIRITDKDRKKDPEISIDIMNNRENLLTYAKALKECRILEKKLVILGVLSNSTYGPSIPSDTESMGDYIEYIRNKASYASHPCCTVRMGGANSSSPIDSRFKLRGTENLRVIDASVLPSPVSGNPNIPLVVLATQAAKSIVDERVDF